MRGSQAILGILFLALLATPASASITIPGPNNGSDGALNVASSDLTIDLGKAVTGSWDQAGTGVGVYDSTKWAVVFKYSSVNIGSGRTVRFINHPSNAPVVWLVQGSATIAGTVNLDGAGGSVANLSPVPGPGGFPGGRGNQAGSNGTCGYGPGGGITVHGSGSNATVGANPNSGGTGGLVYGNARILPLIGGSGGSGASGPCSGSAGGGALLLAAANKVTLTGAITAYGGAVCGSGDYGGAGSGGSVRVIADTLTGTGSIIAISANGAGWGGMGRVRLEANVLSLSQQSTPAYSLEQPLDADGVVIWPPSPEPTVKITSINGQPVTGDPRMDAQALSSGDLVVNNTAMVPVLITAANVPTNATVNVRVVLGADPAYTTAAAFQSGNAAASTWLATLPALSPQRVSAIQVKVVLP